MGNRRATLTQQHLTHSIIVHLVTLALLSIVLSECTQSCCVVKDSCMIEQTTRAAHDGGHVSVQAKNGTFKEMGVMNNYNTTGDLLLNTVG